MVFKAGAFRYLWAITYSLVEAQQSERSIDNGSLVVFYQIELYLDVGNDEYIILCNFGGRIMSCFKIIEPRTVAGRKKPGQNKVKTFLNFLLISDLNGHDRKKSMVVETKKIRFSNYLNVLIIN